MSSVAFLLIAVGLSLAGIAVLVLRSRQPRSIDSGIRDFAREMRALSPETRPGRSRFSRGQEPRTPPTRPSDGRPSGPDQSPE